MGLEVLWAHRAFPGQEVLPVCKVLRGSPARLVLRGR